jgi:OmcA/MtrC family decaheme c-type cytochrome
LDFDASIKGAHIVPQDSSSLKGLVLDILRVDNGTAGRQPTVTFTVKDKSGAAVPLSQLDNLSLLMAGPTSDYGYTSFGSDVTTPGYVSESAIGAQCNTGGTCTYTFQHSIPGGATGSFAIGIESRRTETLLAGTTDEMDVRYGAVNKVFYFSVDGSLVQPRRTVVVGIDLLPEFRRSFIRVLPF